MVIRFTVQLGGLIDRFVSTTICCSRVALVACDVIVLRLRFGNWRRFGWLTELQIARREGSGSGSLEKWVEMDTRCMEEILGRRFGRWLTGGSNCKPKHWKRYTAIAMLGVFLACIPVAMLSAKLEVSGLTIGWIIEFFIFDDWWVGIVRKDLVFGIVLVAFWRKCIENLGIFKGRIMVLFGWCFSLVF